MKNLILTLTVLMFSTSIYPQGEKETLKNVVSRFSIYYNNGSYDSVFGQFSSEMKTALPIDKTTDFLKALKSESGNISKKEFVRYERSYGVYKTNFERALYGLYISIDNDSKINGLFIRPYKEANLPKLQRNTTRMILPFKDEWTVIWGGDTKELNYHVESEAQKNAFDIVITDAKGTSFKTNGEKNEDYYAFGKELMAPCEGEVVMVVDGVKDNKPGTMNPMYVPGNTVVIKTANNEYLFFAHFKQHSIVVKQGQKLKQGQLLGLCGNSGNSSEPHLHFHIQNVEDMNVATGAKCYFDKITVNGQEKNDYSPIKNDKIRNIVK